MAAYKTAISPLIHDQTCINGHIKNIKAYQALLEPIMNHNYTLARVGIVLQVRIEKQTSQTPYL